MQKGRQFVYQELVATEKDYIRDLECVVNVSVVLDHFSVTCTCTCSSFQRVKPDIPCSLHCGSSEG